MPAQLVTHGTFTIERRYPTNAEKVFAAFSDKSVKRRWYTDSRVMISEEFEMDFRVGGRDLARFRFSDASPFPGVPLAYHTTYLDIVPNKRLVYSYSLVMADKIISASLVTFEFIPTDGGTDVLFTEQGAYFEGADGPEMRKKGWGDLLDKVGQVLAR